MKLLIDANILLDVLAKREGHFKDSLLIWKLCEAGYTSGTVSALSVADIVYVLRKTLNAEKTEELVKKLRMIFEFADLSGQELVSAASLRWSDYEDAVQYVTAKRIGADCIISRNVRDFTGSGIPAFTPEEFLDRYW